MTRTLGFGLLVILAFGLGGEEKYQTIKEEKSYADPPTGNWLTNGLITPLDQEMQNFYIRNADGAIEVLLKDNAPIGLQSRVQRG